ncbi:MAG: hypothetical protein BRC55_12070 [Cyanobacteria bacterium SW_8_48_13]|nr:MAG: hypothetical protein BRC55_12070 [Cyanobacteria bacterium SW_8_48_13]
MRQQAQGSQAQAGSGHHTAQSHEKYGSRIERLSAQIVAQGSLFPGENPPVGFVKKQKQKQSLL